MSVQQFSNITSGLTSLTPAARGTILVNSLQATADGGVNKDGSSYQVYDWVNAEKLGFSPTVTFATKIDDRSTMMSAKILVPCASYATEVAAEGGDVMATVPWTLALTIRGGPSNLTTTGLANLKAMIDSLSGMLLLNRSTGVYESQSAVLNSLLRGNALVK